MKYNVVEITPTEISGRRFDLSRPWLHIATPTASPPAPSPRREAVPLPRTRAEDDAADGEYAADAAVRRPRARASCERRRLERDPLGEVDLDD